MAICLFLIFYNCSLVWRARYQWVCCSPDSSSANCIDKKGLMFNLLLGNDVFPLFEDYFGSGPGSGSGNGFLTEIEQEYKPVDENCVCVCVCVCFNNFRTLKRNLPSDNQDLGQDGPEKRILLYKREGFPS
ncbi:unnamed protein product [Nyctereutes procyonoides]|uniref:(raccoon dog) hypothetical protein n=1 Tax=Nyctereutes procyonoides TaxID=34880 RepID=A0A811YLA4_NYCPR|nr:unnamed protein product [Nyctereutes procyonoides]